MKDIYRKCGFVPAKILLPSDRTNMTKWATIACDQYTSDPDYWDRVKNFVGNCPSAYNIVLPEICLSDPDCAKKTEKINMTMEKYLRDGTLADIGECYIYVERTLPDNSVRKGIVGALDLELYDYGKNSTSRIRATEGTIVERIPPRLAVRNNAPIELPHVMVLIDDTEKNIIESLFEKKADFEKLYDFELMMGAGRIAGYRVPDNIAEEIAEKLLLLSKKSSIQFAMGDGNHSFATAKQYYLNASEMSKETARYALCEVVNLHDDSLKFEAIHRVVFDTDAEKLINGLFAKYPHAVRSDKPSATGHSIEICHNGEKFRFFLEKPEYKLAVATLQNYLDEYLKNNAGRIDYIHGKEDAERLAENENSVAFILPAMDKSELFAAVEKDGALPRKTFSMGHADTKRFYLEARRIR